MSKASDPIEAKVDGWLADWPAPERDDDAWESFGSKLDERLAGLTVGRGQDDWFEAPLPAEPGEGGSDNVKLEAGGARMSEPESDKPKRKSLKDFAQRVSVAPPSPSEEKPTGTPLPKAGETPVPVSGPRTSSPSLRASSGAFVSRPPEARDSDSGLLDLDAVRNSAASIPDTGAQPGEAGLLEDDEKPALPPVQAADKKSSMVPIIGGGLVAVLALAAATVLVLRSTGSSNLSSAEQAPAVAIEAQPDPANPNSPAPKPTANPSKPTGLTTEGLAIASAEPSPGAAAPDNDSMEAPVRSETSKDEPARSKAVAATGQDSNKDDEDETKPADPNDLAGAMATAVGADGKEKALADDKSAGSGIDPGAIPEAPSQGAIQGAIGSVKGAAKACVAGLEGPSRASITFASSGAVSSVSVSGAASGTPAAGCIQSALRGARVGPFKRSSFTVGVTIRP